MITSPGEAAAEGLDPHTRRFLRLLTTAGPGAAAPDVHARRKGLEDLAVLAGGPTIPLTRVETLRLQGPGGELRVRSYVGAVASSGASPCIIYVHGGGWCAGSLDTHDSVCRALASESEFIVLAIDYRLAPEHPFPAGLEDVIFAVREIAAQADAFGVDPARLVLAGDSAGATLAVAAAVALREQGGPPLALQLLICPILDVSEARPSRIAFADGFFLSEAAFARDLADYLPPGLGVADPRVSPLLTPSLAGLPPTHIHVAAFDPFRDEGLAYGERLSTAGVETRVRVHPGMIHYFYALPGLIPNASPALAAMAQAARAALG